MAIRLGVLGKVPNIYHPAGNPRQGKLGHGQLFTLWTELCRCGTAILD